ncbi:MAG: DUF1993 domain-containing protein [Acidobacteria bacterium]|jgi:hypothetical protein|nr:DUF1993 domain-containing protein [Acidobacteriota bacterium]
MTTTVSYLLKSSSAQSLGVLKSLLAKGEAYAGTMKCEEAAILAQRLYPDMYPIPRQVQIACDTAARGAARLAEMDMPSFPDTEQTFAELMTRCQKALDYVNGIEDARIDATAAKTLQIPMGQATMPMTGAQYLSSFILPNLHFHASMTYALLRMQGVAIGKRDFLMP